MTGTVHQHIKRDKNRVEFDVCDVLKWRKKKNRTTCLPLCCITTSSKCEGNEHTIIEVVQVKNSFQILGELWLELLNG